MNTNVIRTIRNNEYLYILSKYDYMHKICSDAMARFGPFDQIFKILLSFIVEFI